MTNVAKYTILVPDWWMYICAIHLQMYFTRKTRHLRKNPFLTSVHSCFLSLLVVVFSRTELKLKRTVLTTTGRFLSLLLGKERIRKSCPKISRDCRLLQLTHCGQLERFTCTKNEREICTCTDTEHISECYLRWNKERHKRWNTKLVTGYNKGGIVWILE